MTVPFLLADIRLNAANFVSEVMTDPFTGNLVDGWEDQSGYGNHLIIRQGTPTYENDANGVSCAVFDNTLIASLREIGLKSGAGTLILSFSGGYLANNTRDLVTIERYETTKTRTGNPAWALRRFVGSGFNRTTWATVSASQPLDLGGSSSGDMTVQHVAFGCDMRSTGGGIYAKREGQTAPDPATPNENASRIPTGSDIIFGRLNPSQADASRTAVTGNERMLLSHVKLYGNFQQGNLISDHASDLETIFAGLT